MIKFFGWLSLLACFALAGCSYFSKADAPEQLTVMVSAAADVNPNAEGQASPVVVKIYALKNDTAFNYTDTFFQLYTASGSTAENSDILAVKTAILLPDQKQAVMMQLPEGTHFIGAVAAYQNLNNTVWLTSTNITDRINLKIDRSQIMFKGVWL